MDINDLNWLSGHWQGTINEDPIEEIWSCIHANSMMGMFRWIKENENSLLEFMVLSKEGTEIHLKLKHFDSNLIGEEKKEDSRLFKLENADKNSAVFIYEQEEDYMRLTYNRKDSHNLAARLEMDKEGTKILNFDYNLFHY